MRVGRIEGRINKEVVGKEIAGGCESSRSLREDKVTRVERGLIKASSEVEMWAKGRNHKTESRKPREDRAEPREWGFCTFKLYVLLIRVGYEQLAGPGWDVRTTREASERAETLGCIDRLL